MRYIYYFAVVKWKNQYEGGTRDTAAALKSLISSNARAMVSYFLFYYYIVFIFPWFLLYIIFISCSVLCVHPRRDHTPVNIYITLQCEKEK